MSSKLQVSIPKVLADKLGIKVGDEVAWEAAGETLRVRRAANPRSSLTIDERLRLFDAATDRQALRETSEQAASEGGRGWTRDDLYTR